MSEQIRVSTVTSALSTAPQDYDASTVIEAIRIGGKKLRWQVEQIRDTLRRELTTHGDLKRAKQAAGELKKQLPAVLWSGRFSKRANDALVQHSGLLCADLDSLNGSLPVVHEKLSKSPYVWALFISPGGEGLKAVFRVPPDPSTHLGSFRAIEQHVHELTGIQVDEACKDVARLCFLSYDPGIYHNANATEIEPLQEAEKQKTTTNCTIDLSERQRIASELLGDVKWQSETSGFVVCPAKHLHTTGESERDCKIDLDNVPTLHCFHNSCGGILAGVNHELRSLIGKAEYKLLPAESAALVLGKPVNLAVLLGNVRDYVKRYVVFTGEAQPVVVALWAAHAWAIDAFDYTPYLQVTAPEKQCGKSRVLDCLEPLTPKAWRVISPSEAVLYHKIGVDKPTLLLDESDTLFCKGNDDRGEFLRSLLNAGFERKAKVPRCVNKGEEIKEYAVFCPKAFAGIGSLPDTVNDRCVPIRLRKKRRDESVERFRKREAEVVADPIRERFEAWAKDEKVMAALRSARPEIPDALSDRQQDICEPLLAIADLAGGEWPRKAREALIELCVSEENEESIGVKLLSDIRRVFDEQQTDRLSTIDLVKALVAVETENPWAPWWEKDVASNNVKGAGTNLSRRLKRFGIKSCVIRTSAESTPHGFYRADFDDVWARYCPHLMQPPGKVATTQHDV
jgi:hypothetical protein